jgi:hypothetical protein
MMCNACWLEHGQDSGPCGLGCGCHDAPGPSAELSRELLLALEFAERGGLESPARTAPCGVKVRTPRLTRADFIQFEPRILGRLADVFAIVDGR